MKDGHKPWSVHQIFIRGFRGEDGGFIKFKAVASDNRRQVKEEEER